MDRAKIALFEDNPRDREFARKFLTLFGHEIVVEADNLDDALTVVEGIADGTHEVDLILLDGNLRPNDNSYNDARKVFGRITETGVTKTVFGYSLGSLIDNGIGVKADTYKSYERTRDLISEI